MTSILGELDEMDQRILGALLEKQRTVPASYPLSLNSLRLACNQTTSRDPVVTYNEVELEQRLQDLKQRGLVRIVWAGKGARTLKYHQRLEETLELDESALALITVLLLRGAQSPGELKTRTSRLHEFADRADVEAKLQELAEVSPPLVAELERRQGQQDHRWIHLLGPVAGTASEPEEPPVDRESIIADGVEARDAAVVAAYDEVAEAYADASLPAWEDAEFDRWLLQRVTVWSHGWPVADVGCGPGHTTAFLAEQGAEIVGSDASAAMIAEARNRYPNLEFEVTPFTHFMRPRTAAGWGAIVAWSVIGQSAASEVTPLLTQLTSTLRLGGLLVLKAEVGGEALPETDWFGVKVPVPQVLHEPKQLIAAAGASGLTVVEHYLVGPGSGEVASFYLVGRRDA